MSADIAVPEHERELSFYSSVLCTGKDPLWRKDLMNNLGMPIIGLGARSPEYADLPLQWMPHIQVADVAGSVERALDSGGTEIMHGKDGDGTSQWAVLLDPNGAAFGIIPVVSAEALPSADSSATPDALARAGRITWLDLTVPDAPATCDFYGKVVGWSVQDVELEGANGRDADHRLIGGDGIPAAGVRRARGVDPILPPIWIICLPVGDLAESLRRVREGAGSVVAVTQGTDGEPTHAVIQDPVGVYLSVVQG